MKKLAFIIAVAALVVGNGASAAVTVSTGPTSLVTAPIVARASSAPIALFSFVVSQTAAETLSSVSVTVTNAGSSTATGADFASVSVYKDSNNNGTFDPGSDALAGTQTSVAVGSPTVVTTSANNTIDGGKFFVTLSTGASWSSSGTADSVTVTVPTGGIVTSANSPTVTTATTASITADTVGPVLTSVMAKNTGGTNAKEAGDTIEFTFGEATNKPAITAANIGTIFTVNNSHSLLDGLSSVGGISWNAAGTVLTVTLSAGGTLPTIAVGDTVTVAGSTITDTAGNSATGSVAMAGNFATPDTTGPTLTTAVAKNSGGTSAKEAGDSVAITFSELTNKPTITAANIGSVLTLNNSHSFLDGAGALGGASWDVEGKVLTITLSAGTSLPTVAVGDTVTVAGSVIQDLTGNNATGSQAITGSFTTSTSQGDEDDDSQHGSKCANTLINGRLYKVGSDATVYLAASCRLKPFRGAAVFKARGHKFQDIIQLSALPTNATISTTPVLPAEGTLVKGDKDKTVFFISKHGRKGFVSEQVFKTLGFDFSKVMVISQSDLEVLPKDSNVEDSNHHPDGALIKCGNSGAVFEVIGNARFPFANVEVFKGKGHSFEHVLTVDCGRFQYQQGAPINN